MKRALWGSGAVAVLACVTWACWPSDDAGTPAAANAPTAETDKPARTLAEQLDDNERALEVSDAGLGLVTGIIEDETGRPIAGAEVKVFLPGGHALDSAVCPICSQPILECTDLHAAHDLLEVVRTGRGQPKALGVTTSGPDGTFRFENLPQDELELTARKGDRVGRSTFVPGEETVLMIFTQARLSLKVVRLALDNEAPGVALPGARLSAISLDTFRLLETVTDSSGLARLDGLDEGSGVWVMLEAPGLVPYVGTIYSDQDETELALMPARALLVRTAIGGKPAETTVTVTPGSGQHAITQRTQGGAARFDGLANDSYEVTASTEVMVAPSQSVMLEEDLTTVDLELRAAAKLLVTVIDEMGEPVSDADVTASGRDGDSHSGRSSNGALVVLGPLGEGPITIDVVSDLRPWHRELDLHPGENTLEVVLKKGVKLRGRVVDSEGAPVAQADIEARTPVNLPANTYSELDGSFELAFDEPGPQELTASLSAIGRTTVTVNVPADDVVIRLEVRARVKVFVHEGREPVLGASVTVTPVSGDDLELNSLSGVDGNAVISGLDTGSYRVSVQSPDHRVPPVVTVALTEGRAVSIDVELDRGLSVSGIVVDARGSPVIRADVSTQPWSANAVTDEAGRFTLTTLDPQSSYRIEAGTDLLRSTPQTIKGPQPPLRLVMVERPMVSGRVFDAVTDAPLTEFEVDSHSIESPDGRFSVPVNAGDGEPVAITISADGFETATWEGTLVAARDLGKIRLQKAKMVEGVVRDARGSPVAGAVVTLDYTGDEVTSAADGSFRLALSQYQAGVNLSAQRGQLKGTAPVQLGRLNEIVLQPPTKVQGQVVDANGRPVAGVINVREAFGSDELQVESGPDGAFSLDVAQGRWVFVTRVSTSGQTFVISGPSMRLVLGVPPGSCSLAVQTTMVPDEMLLVPGDQAPAVDASLDPLAELDGAVLFATTNVPQISRAAGFRCGAYTLVARWGTLQRTLRVDVHSGSMNDVVLAAPDLEASAPLTHP